MKKIILGLFLTVGVSGITLANTADDLKEKNEKKSEASQKAKGVCEYTTVTSYVDTCGSLQGRSSSWPTWQECPSGVQTGTRITTPVTVVVGPVKKCDSIQPTETGTGG
jgi:LysM repeat protein